MDKDAKMMIAIMGIAVMGSIVVALVQMNAPPGPQFECPIDGEKFYTYDELYQHFITNHPTQPIDIIWE